MPPRHRDPKHVVGVHARRQLDQANPPAARAIALSGSARRRQADRITIGDQHHLLDLGRQRQPIEIAGAERAPDREIRTGFSDAQASLDAFAKGEPSSGSGEPHGAATTRAEHLLGWLHVRLAAAIVPQEGAMQAAEAAIRCLDRGDHAGQRLAGSPGAAAQA